MSTAADVAGGGDAGRQSGADTGSTPPAPDAATDAVDALEVNDVLVNSADTDTGAALPDTAPVDAEVAAPDAAVPDIAVADASAPDTPAADTPAPDVAAADAASDVPWFPSWKDPNGCENYQHWAGGTCVSENPQQEKLETFLCWKNGQVNDLGVGKPCLPGVGMCKGLAASCCVADAKKYGALCSMACNSSVECGAGAYCHLSFGGGICMPASCTQLFDGFYETYRKKDKGFTCGAAANAKGVGTVCQAGGAACAPFAGAWCLGDGPQYLPAGQPQYSSFCTVGCQNNSDCGADAECIFSNGKPYFCAPTACSAQFASVIFVNKPGGIGAPGSDETCNPE